MKDLRNLRKKQKGITLIALVITIIVMLILVAVTISMAINGGLFNYAGKATGETKNAIESEQELANLEANLTVDELIEKYTGGSKGVDLSLVNVGDYISNYPVEYTNVASATNINNDGTDSNYPSGEFIGWRVLSKEIDGQGNVLYVKLISSGVPLSYYHYNDVDTSIEALTTNFLKTEITSTPTQYKFYKCGLKNVTGATLESTFENKFTDKVQALTKTELDKAVIDLGGSETSAGDYVTDAKYKDLFSLSCSDTDSRAYYWITGYSAVVGTDAFLAVHEAGYIKPNLQNVKGIRVVVSLNPSVQFMQASENINDTTTWEISL